MTPVTNISSPGWRVGDIGNVPTGCEVARVARVDRGRLTVLAATGERCLWPGGTLHDETVPAVGDWVAVRGELAVAVLPRRTAFVRTAAGRGSAAQVVAANVDVVFVVDSLVGEARLRRVERYLAASWASGATPVVVLTKADLCPDVPAAVAQVAEDAIGVEVLPVSALTGSGLDRVAALLPPDCTAAMVGPSGMGKSSSPTPWPDGRSPTPPGSGTTAVAGTPRPHGSCTCCPAVACWWTPPVCASWR